MISHLIALLTVLSLALGNQVAYPKSIKSLKFKYKLTVFIIIKQF